MRLFPSDFTRFAMQELRVHLLPALVDPADLAGRTVVVVDVLRATTTICRALQAGAACVVPCLEIDEARETAAKLGPDALLGGERLGRRIEGFHFGNSPSEYTAAAVADRTVVFTTTNGTRAMRRAAQAGELLMGAFVNLSTLAKHLSQRQAIDIVCAGTNGAITFEDALFAGALIERVCCSYVGPEWQWNDQARLAFHSWQNAVPASVRDSIRFPVAISMALRECQGGRNLIAEGFDADIDTAAAIDACGVLPRLDQATGRITLR
ncbi:MAG: 2-phosphosulfolactate phosphatase [Pirellula sp.]|nr:2-phosphosulfolactate phosphatase [Pirellula sp.]